MVANIPGQWKGFSIVVATLGIHVLTVFVSVVLFMKGTKVSMPGNAWQAVCQIVELVDKDVLGGARDMRDKGVEGVLRASGRGSRVVKVS